MKTYLKNSVIYQVYVRNFTKEGTFNALKQKLDYIKNLKVDILYLLPISPIGKEGRKGDLGSPYSISDYTKINPELGTLEDFKSLIEATHNHDMKIMIDIVFNHTSRDSYIAKNHPEWMYHNKEGKMANKVGDWSDVYDLDYSNPALIKYLVDVIQYYCSIGVDGFRFDVASLISKEFYIALKKMLNEKYPSTILLAEAIHPFFTDFARSLDLNPLSDGELSLYAFDMLYQYSSISLLSDYLNTKEIRFLDMYKIATLLETTLSTKDTLRIRGLENHDQKRLYEYTHDFTILRNLAASQAFMKGPMFIYNGLETKADHLENLFTKDTMDLTIDESWFNFIIKLITFKKDELNLTLNTTTPLLTRNETLAFKNTYANNKVAFGLFSLTGKEELIEDSHLDNGNYTDYLTNKEYKIINNSIRVKEPIFLIKK